MIDLPGRLRPLLTFGERALVVGVLASAATGHAPAQEAASGTGPWFVPVAGGLAPARDHGNALRPPRFAQATLPDGVRLHFAEQGAPDGAAVILLHGYTDSWFSWSEILSRLPDDLHVFALDQRGQGASDRPVHGYRVDELARDVIAFMDVQGIYRAIVVGHSGGGLVAQHVAAAAPERVEGIVLVSTATTARRVVGLDELRDAVAALEDPVDIGFVRDFQEGTVHAPVPAAFMDRVVADSGRLPAWTWQALLDGMVARGPVTGLAGRGLPTLILWGDRDRIFTLEEQEALIALTGGTFKMYPATGHALHWERPDTFARDLTEFALALGSVEPAVVRP